MSSQSVDSLSSTTGQSQNFKIEEEKSWLFRPFITKEGAENLRNYKYAGQDDGLAYIYFFEPLAEWLVTFVPMSIAPNTLTFMGFCCTVFPLVLLYLTIGCALIGDSPGWFIALQGILYFIYRCFDEMDGKQARRTKNGSPLGMVFDHGVDCFAAGIQPLIFARIMQVGDNFIAKIFFMSIFQTFHLMTLEHYYKGILVMPPINGVSDGCLWITSLSLYTAYVGNNYFATPVYDISHLGIDGVEMLTWGQCLALLVSGLTFILGLQTMYGIYMSKYKPTPT